MDRIEFTWLIAPTGSHKANRKAIKAHRLKLKKMWRSLNRLGQRDGIKPTRFRIHYQLHEPRDRSLRPMFLPWR